MATARLGATEKSSSRSWRGAVSACEMECSAKAASNGVSEDDDAGLGLLGVGTGTGFSVMGGGGGGGVGGRAGAGTEEITKDSELGGATYSALRVRVSVGRWPLRVFLWL